MRKIICYLLFLVLLFSCVSCGKVEDNRNPGNQDIDNPIKDPSQTDTPIKPPSNETVEFKVSLNYNKKTYIPKDSEKIQVVWSDDFMQHTAIIGKDGYAVTQLDGDFNVYLANLPDGYSYNPNIYNADNENPEVVIELVKISRISKGKGVLKNEYLMSTAGMYRAEIAKSQQQVFFEFEPTKAGYYVLETMVNVFEDTINPKVDIYTGNAGGFRNLEQSGLDSGGLSLKNGFTKNVKWVVKLTEDMIHNSWFFAIYADSKTGVYPINIDFSITYEGEWYVEDVVSKLMVAQEISSYYYCETCHHILSKTNTPRICPKCGGVSINTAVKPIQTTSSYTFINSDGGVGNYYGGVSNGSGLLIGASYKYNEETGFWHVYNNQTGEFGPVLCAKISQKCAYYEEALTLIESHGNKNLTVSNGTENYKVFIEESYAAACNSDGVCYVTNELKEFLQKFSVAQRLFFDGNGFVESTGVYAAEEDQWLFACGYYIEK